MGKGMSTNSRWDGRYSLLWLCVISVLASTSAFRAGAQEDPALGTWTPTPTVVQGDTTLDAVTDLKDLILLGKNWDDQLARRKFKVNRQELLSDVSDNWKQRVPATLDKLTRKGLNGPFLTASLARTSTYLPSSAKAEFDKALAANSKDGDGQKNVQFQQIGYGITFPENSQVPTINSQIFRSPAEFPLNERVTLFPNDEFVNLEGGYDDSSDFSSYPRYGVAASQYYAEYISDFAEALDAYGIDVAVSARYGLFSGDFDFGLSSLNLRDERSHRIVVRYVLDFGWDYAPDSTIQANLTQTFQDDLALALQDPFFDLTPEYGTHYIFAQHRVAEIFIEITFNTKTELKRQDVEAALNINVSGTGSFSLRALYDSVNQNVKGVTNTNVRVRQFGGPGQVDIDGNGSLESIEATLTAALEGGSSSSEISAILEAWTDALQSGPDLPGRAVDFLARPISEFLNVPDEPFSVQQSLRNWAIAFIATQARLEQLNEYLDVAGNAFDERYDYFEQTGPIGPGTTWRGQPDPTSYAFAIRQQLVDSYLNLYEQGKEIYESSKDDTADPPVFLPGLEDFPRFELPRPALRVDAPGIIVDLGFVPEPRAACSAGGTQNAFDCRSGYSACGGGAAITNNQCQFIECIDGLITIPVLVEGGYDLNSFS